MKLRKILRMVPVAAALAVAAALVVTGCGGSSLKPLAATTLSYKVVGPDDGLVGSDGEKHDTFYALSATSAQVGQQVTISVANFDDMPHSFTSPELGINIMLPPAKGENDPTIATYTFTPTKAGKFRWFCAIPCDSDTNGWAMNAGPKGIGVDGFLAGYITVGE
jgi:heme/copper-type cytochrome/quinol oxidase subunit 2